MSLEDEYSHWQHEWCDDCIYGPSVIVKEPWSDTYKISMTAWGNWHIVSTRDRRSTHHSPPHESVINTQYLWRRLLVRK